MKAWKRNAIIAAVLLVVCAGVYLNWIRGEKTADLTDTLNGELLSDETSVVMGTQYTEDDILLASSPEPDELSADEYFAQLRLSRQKARDEAVNLLQEAMAYEGEDTGESSGALTQIVSDSLAEAQIESLVMAKGYLDCVAYMADEVISVAVAAPENGLQQEDVALISDIVTSQCAYPLTNVRIIEVK